MEERRHLFETMTSPIPSWLPFGIARGLIGNLAKSNHVRKPSNYILIGHFHRGTRVAVNSTGLADRVHKEAPFPLEKAGCPCVIVNHVPIVACLCRWATLVWWIVVDSNHRSPEGRRVYSAQGLAASQLPIREMVPKVGVEPTERRV